MVDTYLSFCHPYRGLFCIEGSEKLKNLRYLRYFVDFIENSCVTSKKSLRYPMLPSVTTLILLTSHIHPLPKKPPWGPFQKIAS
jgi:hypothetical protein